MFETLNVFQKSWVLNSKQTELKINVHIYFIKQKAKTLLFYLKVIHTTAYIHVYMQEAKL